MKKVTYKCVIFIHTRPPPSLHLGPTLNQLCDSVEKKWSCLLNHECTAFLTSSSFEKLTPLIAYFKKSEHVEIARSEVRTVRRMFEELKFQIWGGLKSVVSRMRTGIFVLQNTVCDNRPLRFVRVGGSSWSVKGRVTLYGTARHDTTRHDTTKKAAYLHICRQ
jgi:hypothetical protein